MVGVILGAIVADGSGVFVGCLVLVDVGKGVGVVVAGGVGEGVTGGGKGVGPNRERAALSPPTALVRKARLRT